MRGRLNKTLADYLALEDRVFKEMEEKVYSKTRGGELFALDRYQHGSISDPTGYSPDYNRSFEWKHEQPKAGALLLHGLSDSPYRKLRAERYASFGEGKGAEFAAGKLTLEALAAIGDESGEPRKNSGKHELYESLINQYI